MMHLREISKEELEAQPNLRVGEGTVAGQTPDGLYVVEDPLRQEFPEPAQWVAPELSEPAVTAQVEPVPEVTPPATEDVSWVAPEISAPTSVSTSEEQPFGPGGPGLVAPFERDPKTGEWSVAEPLILKAVREAVKEAFVDFPRDVFEGKKSQEELNRRAFNAAAVVTPGGVASRFAKPLAKVGGLTGEKIVKAAENLNVDVPISVALGGSPGIKSVAIQAKNVPFIGSKLIEAQKKALDQTSKKLVQIQKEFGDTTTAAAGETIRSALDVTFKKTIPDKISKMYDKVNAVIDPDYKRPLTYTTEMIKKLRAKRKEAAMPGKSKAINLVSLATRRLPKGGKAKIKKGEKVAPEGLNFEGIKTLRAEVGRLLDDPHNLPSGMSPKELKAIYKSLSDDLKATVGAAAGSNSGAVAMALFKEATIYNAKQMVIKKKLGKVLKLDTDEGVYNKIIAAAGSTGGADVRLLKNVRRSLSKGEWDEVAGTAISQMGRDATGEFDPSIFMREYGKTTKFGRQMLFATTGKKQLKKALDDISTLSKAFHNMKSMKEPGQLIQAGMLVSAAGGFFVDPVSTLKVLVAPLLAANILSRSATASSFASWAKIHNKIAGAPLSLIPKLNAQAKEAWGKLNIITIKEFGEDAALPEYKDVTIRKEETI